MAIISLNTEIIQSDVLSNVDRTKISHLVKTNYMFPEIAFGLVQNYCVGIDKVKRIVLDSESTPNKINVVVDETVYIFNLEKIDKAEVPSF